MLHFCLFTKDHEKEILTVHFEVKVKFETAKWEFNHFCNGPKNAYTLNLDSQSWYLG